MGAVTRQGMNFTFVAVGVLLALWLVLVFSGRGILVWFTVPRDREVGMLECQYFTGVEVVERKFLYSKQGFLGRDTCPRSVELK